MSEAREAGARLDEATPDAAAAPIFNAVQATLSYVRARGDAPEDDVLRAVQAHEEEHAERVGEDPPWPKPLAVLRMVLALVARGDLVRDGQVLRCSRPAIDTRMGCVEKAIERRRAGT